jgi:hypothetical protein
MTVPERAALSRELADFLIELSIALHKHAMYPEGHPSLAPAAAGVARRAEELLENRPTLALGVARQQLVIEGVATDPKNPLLAELAGRLHRHHLGAVTFHRGVRTGEVTDLLRTLAVDAERTGQPLGLGERERLRVWDHVRLHAVTYEKLELLHQDGEAPPDSDDKGKALRSAQLWIGLARAALTVDDESAAPPTEPAVIARAIDEHPSSAAYDQVVVGYLLQIADELKSAGGAEAVALRRRTSKLMGALRPGTLRRLIEMGGDVAQRTKFAIDATHGLAVDAVLEIVRAMADASHKSVSDPLMRMLTKLASHAERNAGVASIEADEMLRDQVRNLLTGWSLEDPNPERYGDALQRMASALPQAAATPATLEAEPLRLVETGIEVGVLGVSVWRAMDRLLHDGQTGPVLDVLELAPESAAPLWDLVASPHGVRRLATNEPPDFSSIDRVLTRLPAAAFEPLLDALAQSESRTTRRGLLDRLARAPREIGPLVLPRLTSETPWYVVRNLLIVLDGLPELPAGFSAAPFAAHDDTRVRREALKLMLKLPAERDSAILGALADPDPRTLRLALSTALESCPPAATSVIAELATSEKSAPDLRVLAIKVLGRAKHPAALAALLTLTDGGKTWLGKPKLPARSLVLIAALLALATSWRSDARAAAILALAAGAVDPEIRNAAVKR